VKFAYEISGGGGHLHNQLNLSGIEIGLVPASSTFGQLAATVPSSSSSSSSLLFSSLELSDAKVYGP
jgi:hypothetical protein